MSKKINKIEVPNDMFVTQIFAVKCNKCDFFVEGFWSKSVANKIAHAHRFVSGKTYVSHLGEWVEVEGCLV